MIKEIFLKFLKEYKKNGGLADFMVTGYRFHHHNNTYYLKIKFLFQGGFRYG